MFEGVHLVSVLVSAILMMAIGSIWYSPLLFGNHWMRATGLTEADLETSKNKMPKLFAYGMIANLILLFVIAKFVSFAQSISEPLHVVGSLLFILISAVTANAVIWEQKPISYLLINAGYAAVVVFGGMTVLWYWPW